MTELFESTLDNVSDIDIKCYSDPDPEHAVLEIFATSGEEAYMYKFTGPGVRINGLYKLMTNNEKLRSENQNLKEENKNLKRKKEDREVSAVAAKEKNKLLEIENEKLKRQLDDIQKTKELVEICSHSRLGILEQAKKCVCGQREQDYGTPESNFQLIADLWNGYLGEKTDNPVISVTPVDVSMMMALMKIARIRNGGGSGDSFVDLAGYAACGGEIWDGERHKGK